MIRSHLTSASVLEEESEVQHATKFSVKSGANRASVLVFNTGNINVQGAASELKLWCENLKQSVKDGTELPGVMLPPEIENFPNTLRDRVPDCDDVVHWFFSESIKCYKAGSYAGAAFMLGAASEKAILLLIDSFRDNISDETKRNRFRDKTNNKMISVRFEKFQHSYSCSTPKPTEMPLAQDLDQLLGNAFTFYRSTRNTVGHPVVLPDIDPGVILANMGQFIVYVERIWGLMKFFDSNDIAV